MQPSPDALASMLALPPVATAAALARARGLPVVLVGGAVRDALLSGRPEPADFDFAVQGDAIGLARQTANALDGDVYVMDAERGVARVLLPATASRPACILDFVKCRGASWLADLQDRDFTLNAIACDINSGELIDPLGGAADLHTGALRAVGPRSVSDDPVRAIRGVRLAHQFALTIDAPTWQAIGQAATQLAADAGGPSAERVRDAFMDLLDLEQAAPAVEDLWRSGVLRHILPELAPLDGLAQSAPHTLDVLTHTFMVHRAVTRVLTADGFAADVRAQLIAHLAIPVVAPRSRRAVFRLAVLLHDCGKVLTRSVDRDGRIRFLEHEAVGARMAASRASALRLSADEVNLVRTVVANHMRPNQFARDAESMTPRALHRLMRQTGACAPDLALLGVCDCLGKARDASIADCDRSVQVGEQIVSLFFSRYQAAVAPAPLLGGADVLAMGVSPGPVVGRVLEAVREAQMAGEIHTEAEARALARQLISELA